MTHFISFILGMALGGAIVAGAYEIELSRRPQIKAVVTTNDQSVSKALKQIEENTKGNITMRDTIAIGGHSLMAAVRPDGNAGSIKLDVKGRVIAKCEVD